ncbi:hypothetical protein M422DRAFT_251336 [Sphaerobolus stellatus SS14]|uniref:Uncharacterized protein n=1 Tax=Sphaerobolus stellatus (strain SS14) TaxID=990650 RepID=A0A0C9UQC8_SPHS4|nr:hypothetical protein M422DRAFT_251336 [Sphaerobolus stellatus SS14]
MFPSRTHQAPKDRKARVPHAPYSSPPLSPATESIYSCDEYSPRSQYAPESVGSPRLTGYPISLTGLNDEDETATISSGNKNDSSPILPDDDFVSFTSSPTPTPMDQDAANRRETEFRNGLGDNLADEVTNEVRNDLAPKMRFVSPAPWEIRDDEDPSYDDEYVGASDALSIISGKFGGWRYRESEKPTIRSLALASMRSTSPNTPSPPGQKDSFSIGRKTQELDRDDVSAHYMRGDSMSGKQSNPFGNSPRSSDSTDEKPSITARHRLPNSQFRDTSPAPPPDNYPSSYSRPFRGQGVSHRQEREESIFHFSSSSLSPSRMFHPYAHPEVVASSESLVPATPGISHQRLSDEQQLDVTIRRSSESSSSPRHNQSTIRKASAPELPIRKLPSRTKMSSHEEAEELSSHVFPVQSSAAWPGAAPFSDYSSSPMNNLISLEQARARVQKGKEQVNTTPPKSTSVATASFSSSPSTETISEKSSSTSRQRTMSTGKRSIAGGDGDPIAAPKALKHKRSAFLKLFSGKEKDSPPKERDATTISISDPILRSTSTPPRMGWMESNSDIPPVPPLQNIKRIPPPSLSIVVSSPSVPVPDPDGQDSIMLAPSPSTTVNSPPDNSQYLYSSRLTLEGHRPRPDSGVRPPASAPPSQTRFAGLSLRPVSTIFSAGFTDILGDLSSPPPADQSFPSSRSNPSPRTPNIGSSPTLPAFEASRSNSMSTASDYPLTPTNTHPLPNIPTLSSPSSSTSYENPNAVIASLQTEMANLRKIHQRQVWELEGQVRDLKEEMEQLRNTGECEVCGADKQERRMTMMRAKSGRPRAGTTVSVVDRPRPKNARPSVERSVFGGNIG